MQGSINFDGSLIGNITGRNSEVVITPVLTSGTKIADVTVDGEDKDLFAPYQSAVNTSYDNTISGFTADNVQEAIDKISGITGDGQLDIGDDLTDAVNKIKQSLSDLETLEKTVSGAIVTFDDGSDLPMPSLKVSIEPVQSGSGDPSPSNVRPIIGWDEVNVYNLNDSTKAPFFRGLLNGTYNFNNLGSLTWYKSNETFYAYLPEHKVVAGNSPIKAISSNGMEFLQMPGSRNDEYIMITDSDYASYTAAQFKGAMNGVYLIYELATPTTPTITPQQFNTLLEAFNINGHTYTIDLDGTRYGGELDVVSGLLTITDGYIASYNGETLSSTWISDRDVYAEGTTPTVGAEVVYKLATSQTIQLTPTQVKSLLGRNNAWANTGNIELTYLTNNPLTQTVYDMVKILVEQST